MHKYILKLLACAAIASPVANAKVKTYIGFGINPGINTVDISATSNNLIVFSNNTQITNGATAAQITAAQKKSGNSMIYGYSPFGSSDLSEMTNLDLLTGLSFDLRNGKYIFAEARIGWGSISNEFVGGSDGVFRNSSVKLKEDKSVEKILAHDSTFTNALTLSNGFNIKIGGGMAFLKHGNLSLFGAAHAMIEKIHLKNRSANIIPGSAAKVNSPFNFGIIGELGAHLTVTRNIKASVSLFYTFRFEKNLPSKLTVYQENTQVLVSSTPEGAKAQTHVLYDKPANKAELSGNYKYSSLGARIAVKLYI